MKGGSSHKQEESVQEETGTNHIQSKKQKPTLLVSWEADSLVGLFSCCHLYIPHRPQDITTHNMHHDEGEIHISSDTHMTLMKRGGDLFFAHAADDVT